MNADQFQFTLEEPYETARSRCLTAIQALGWQVNQAMTQSHRIACYVPIPDLLPQAPVYSISLYPEQHVTHITLLAANDDLSQTHAAQDLPTLKTAIITGQAQPAAPSHTSRPGVEGHTPATCFISYRRFDSADVVGRIYDRLVAAFGADTIFKDVDNIPIGVDFRQVLDEALSRCAVVLVVIGRDWLTVTDEHNQRRLDDPADFVRIEIETALNHNVPIVPVLVRGAAMPHEEAMPESLKGLVYRHGIQIRSDPDFHRDMDRLIQSLGQLL